MGRKPLPTCTTFTTARRGTTRRIRSATPPAVPQPTPPSTTPVVASTLTTRRIDPRLASPNCPTEAADSGPRTAATQTRAWWARDLPVTPPTDQLVRWWCPTSSSNSTWFPRPLRVQRLTPSLTWSANWRSASRSLRRQRSRRRWTRPHQTPAPTTGTTTTRQWTVLYTRAPRSGHTKSPCSYYHHRIISLPKCQNQRIPIKTAVSSRVGHSPPLRGPKKRPLSPNLSSSSSNSRFPAFLVTPSPTEGHLSRRPTLPRPTNDPPDVGSLCWRPLWTTTPCPGVSRNELGVWGKSWRRTSTTMTHHSNSKMAAKVIPRHPRPWQMPTRPDIPEASGTRDCSSSVSAPSRSRRTCELNYQSLTR